MVICIIATVLLYKPRSDAELNYTKVQVQVVSSETVERTVRTKYSTTHQTEYEVVVRYNGQNYDLKNAHNSYSYRKGATVTAYLYNGSLYANEEGVRSASPLGIAYSVALVGSFVMLMVTLVLWSKEGSKKKTAAQQQQ